MTFSSMLFLWLFLPILLVVYYICPKKIALQNGVLLVFSLLFYAWGEPFNILFMIMEIVINYLFGIWMSKTRKKSLKKIILILSLITNLGMLGYFKYATFLSNNINKIFHLELLKGNKIALPIGISFYTFQMISYMIDLYRNEIIVQKNPFYLALYISFFPQLIAGPIVKYHDIEKQLTMRKLSSKKFADGIRRFSYGLAKKVILANTFANFVDSVYTIGMAEFPTYVSWLSAICYMFQIYYDFSGYSDMAIGLGKMFGFDFSENFKLPYLATSITEFWQKWHISLSTWFKTYLYIPIGGNRKGKIRTYINLGIVFLTTGLWHGAAWKYIFWGMYHGFFIIIERVFLKKKLENHHVIGHIYTLAVVLVGWVFFRAPSLREAFNILGIMFKYQEKAFFDVAIYASLKKIIFMIICIAINYIALSKYKNKYQNNKIISKMEPLWIGTVLILSAMILASDTYNPFIYFRF